MISGIKRLSTNYTTIIICKIILTHIYLDENFLTYLSFSLFLKPVEIGYGDQLHPVEVNAVLPLHGVTHRGNISREIPREAWISHYLITSNLKMPITGTVSSNRIVTSCMLLWILCIITIRVPTMSSKKVSILKYAVFK